ncbi:hypothetical protein IMSHALPRED_010700 [Imshaugia aleurites]|uniref:Uncharacterized protein n=1 Tax=Imshaugia aleurites TaxID=172621 RepID=A0A8H3GAX8_9LECA|nr:hypothetical protein IMSHALPRED_010700 [Imshaugia aleurites]
MDALQGDLKPYQSNHLSFMQRSKAIWNENTLRGHQDRVSHQAMAMTCLLQAIQLKSSLARNRLIDEAEPILCRSDESAYSIVPSRMSSRVSKSTYRNSTGGASIASAEMAYRRLSFENDLFTAKAYKRNYRNPRIDFLFKSKRSRPPKSNSLSTTRSESTVPPSVHGGAIILNTDESLQVHFQKEFATEQAKQSYVSALEGLCKLDNDKALLEACRSGDTKIIESCLKHQRSYDAQSFARKLLFLEALKEAIAVGYHDVVRKLISLEIPINSRLWWSLSGTHSWLPLQFAAHRGDVAMARLLLEAGANVSPTGSGTQPIHIATHRGSLEITSLLLNAGAAIDSTDSCGFQPIHLASAYTERSAQIVLLVNAGANVEALNPLAPSWQKSPLQLACLTGQLANVCALLDLGAIKDTGRSLLDAPLGIAIRQRHVRIVQVLLEQGADANYASRSESKSLFANQSRGLGGPGMTPLSLLVKNFGDARRETALDQAMLDLLLEHGADVQSRDDHGNQVLHYLCRSHHSVNLDFMRSVNDERLVLTLLAQGIDINARNYNGEGPLYLAAANCNEPLVSLLLLNGARRLSSAELWQLHRILEGVAKGRPDIRDKAGKMMRLLDPKEDEELREKVPRRA